MFRPPPRGYSASELPPRFGIAVGKQKPGQARGRASAHPRRHDPGTVGARVVLLRVIPSCQRGDGAESVSEDSRRARRRWRGGSRIVLENVATVSVRYIVDDVDSAIEFYCRELDFEQVMHPAPTFAVLALGDLRLVLSAPGGGPGGGEAMPDGTLPKPGGWNRIQLEVTDIAAVVKELRDQGASFRNDIVTGVGGKQILLEDPSGNPIELFEPMQPEARLQRS